MNRRYALPTAGVLILGLSGVFVPFMKHSVDTALTGDANTALASKGIHGVAASSDWASLTLRGKSSSKTAAMTAVHKMGNSGAVNAVKYICTDAGPCTGTPAGTAAAPSASGTATASPSASASSSAGAGAGATASPSASASASAVKPGSAAAKAKAKDITRQIRKQLGTAGVGFDTGSATLNSQGKSVLNHVASLLNQAPNLKVKIAGYTDNTGNASLNKSLSAARAKATEKYLAAHGVAASRMTSAGYGEADPVASNATAAGRAKNRRIVFTVQGG